MIKMVCLGDSLTRGYGVRLSQGWTALLAQHGGFNVVNQGINGDTTGGMLARFDEDVTKQSPTHVLIMGGVNDLMFQVPLSVIKANVAAMVQKAYHHKIKPILGVSIPILVEDAREQWAIVEDFQLVADQLTEYRKWLLEYGAYFQVKVLDFYKVFENLPTERELRVMYLDGLHLTAKGNELLAQWAVAELGLK